MTSMATLSSAFVYFSVVSEDDVQIVFPTTKKSVASDPEEGPTVAENSRKENANSQNDEDRFLLSSYGPGQR